MVIRVRRTLPAIRRCLPSIVLAAACACPPSAQSQACAPPTKITSTYDRFRDQTVVTLDRLGFGATLPVPGTRLCYFTTNLIIDVAFAGSAAAGDPQILWTIVTLVSPGTSSPDAI